MGIQHCCGEAAGWDFGGVCGQSPWVQAEAFAAGRGCGRQQRDLRGSVPGALRPAAGPCARAPGGREPVAGRKASPGRCRVPGRSGAQAGRSPAEAGQLRAVRQPGSLRRRGAGGKYWGDPWGRGLVVVRGSFRGLISLGQLGLRVLGRGDVRSRSIPLGCKFGGISLRTAAWGWGTKSAPVLGGSEEGSGLLEGPGAVPIAVVSGTSPTFPLQWPPPAESRSTGRCR